MASLPSRSCERLVTTYARRAAAPAARARVRARRRWLRRCRERPLLARLADAAPGVLLGDRARQAAGVARLEQDRARALARARQRVLQARRVAVAAALAVDVQQAAAVGEEVRHVEHV